METLLNAFCQSLQAQGRSIHTIQAYRRDLLLLERAIHLLDPAANLDALTPAMLDAALTHPIVLKSGANVRAPASLRRIKTSIKSFFGWAAAQGRIATDPARGIRLPRAHSRTPPFLSVSEKNRLLKELRCRTGHTTLRDRVIFELMLGTGIRLAELVGLNVSDVDLETKHLRIRAKGNRTQVKFLGSGLRTLLRTWLKARRRQASSGCDALFLSNRGARISRRQVANRLTYWLQRTGIEKPISPHSLRHTFATHLLESSNNLLLVQRALGHRNITTTSIYTHLVDGELEDALERL